MSDGKQIRVDRKLLEEVEQTLPGPFRGEKRSARCVDFALREYLRLKKAAEQQKSSTPAEAST